METTPTMSKIFLSTMVAALVCVCSQVPLADQGISAKTLSDMGLSGLTVMSDSAALAVRGHGFRGGNHSNAAPAGSAAR